MTLGQGYTFIVGDVHGCLRELEDLVKKLGYVAGRDQMYFTGDLVDKGPDSKGVVDYVRELAGIPVLGNHDDKHVRYRKHLKKAQANAKYKNPMVAAEWFLAAHDDLTDDDIEWMSNLPRKLIVGEWMLVHAGALLPGMELYLRYVDANTNEFIAWDGAYGRPANGVFWTERWGGMPVVYGHQPWCNVRHQGNTWGIDTGCVHGGRLTALAFEGEPHKDSVPEIVSVAALEKYDPREVGQWAA